MTLSKIIQQSIYDKPEIEILRGISGSGKSTYALELEKKGYHVISRDRIREELLGSKENLSKYFEHKMDVQLENYITLIEHKDLAKCLSKSQNVVIDNTNLRKKYIQEYVDIIADFFEPSTLHDVKLLTFHITLEEAKERIRKRQEKPVADDVLNVQYERYKSLNWEIEDFIIREGDKLRWDTSREKKSWFYPKFNVEKAKQSLNKEKIFLCDVDGTIAHRKILEDDDIFYMRSYYDYEECFFDEPDMNVISVLQSLSKDYPIIFLSGRKESARIQTLQFIRKYFGENYFNLFMRKEDDIRSDDIVKYEIFKYEIEPNYQVLGVFDDRNRVCAMWEELGLKVFNVGSLNDDF